MKTPNYMSITLVANGFQPIFEYGRFICLLTVTGKTSILLGMDDDAPKLFYPGMTIDCHDRHFGKVVLANPGAGAATVEMTIGETEIVDNRGNVAMGTMATTLTAILARLAGVATMVQPTIIGLPASPAAGGLILAVNATRKKAVVEASLTNPGNVYLGNAAAHSSDVDCFAMLAPGQAWFDEYYQGAVYGSGSDAAEQVVAYSE